MSYETVDTQNKIEADSSANDVSSKILESRFECPICFSWLREPVLTSCGHKFCSECIHPWLEKKNGCCPVCTKILRAEKDLFPDLCTSRELLDQKIKCQNHQFGCNTELCPIDMEKHVNECQYKSDSAIEKFHCEFKHVGCNEVFDDEETREKHLEENANVHLTLMGKALSEMIISQSEANKRVKDSKLWDPPPKTTSEREKPSPDSQHLLKELYERIVVLEQQNREQSITLANQASQIAVLKSTVSSYENKFLRNCNGIYIWRLDNFSQKITEMVTESKMFYSDEFYTHRNGYKVCGRMNTSKKNLEYLSIVLHMVPSENDDGLDWPFVGVISFILVHPHDSKKSIKERTYSQPGLEAFKRPVGERNRRSFGYTEFLSLHELPNFIKNDELIFRIEVKASDRYDPVHLNRIDPESASHANP